MPAFAELEIGLHRRDGFNWTVELRFSQPREDADVRLVPDGTLVASIDLERLRNAAVDEVTYGRVLSDGLFGAPGVGAAFAQARAAADSRGVPLRVRLFIGPSAPELHGLRWETLRDPDDDSVLLTKENVVFSRYLSSLDWRPVGVRPKTELRALVVVASPGDLDRFDARGPLAPVDVDAELERATIGLADVEVTTLPGSGLPTMANLFDRLRDGYDILYVACHGYLVPGGEPQLLLETDAGTAQRVSGSSLVDRLRELRRPPRLVVLASCQSAGSGAEPTSADGGVLAALGPRMAEAGIPAVLAMQGDISMRTVDTFMPSFFRELQRDGQIDHAVAVARGTVRDRPDWWAPALFMRLKSGRIWYAPGFAGEGRGFEKWPALFNDIRQQLCTPVLGPGLTDSLLGSRQEIAQRWASTYHFPMAPHYRDDLPQVAQYLSVNLNYRFPREELVQYLRKELYERYADDLADELSKAELDELLHAVWQVRRDRGLVEPYSVLAELPFPIFIITHQFDLLADALTAAGKSPAIELCPWTADVDWPSSVFADDPTYRPDPQRPLVYHLFGHLRQPETIVLTEDNYFDFLIGVTSNKDLVPPVVRRAFASTALLFLGFRLDAWDFRVLFRSIMNQEGRSRRRMYTHVAVQIDPEEGQTLEPDRARRYLETYFQDADISIYWGSTEDFIKELHAGWKAYVQ